MVFFAVDGLNFQWLRTEENLGGQNVDGML
jgi:hypothetical protein